MKRVIIKEEVVEGNHSTVVHTALNGRYRLWIDSFTHKIRWAVFPWPDDGLGLFSHGSAYTADAAFDACVRDHKLREEANGQ